MSLVSHRGAAGLAPENSKQGILIARAYHPRYVEVDIHCTFDGVFVVHHGDSAFTYTGKRLPKTFMEISASIPHLLPLRELLIGREKTTNFMFDIKCADDIDALIAFLGEHGLEQTHAYTSPHVIVLDKIKQWYPSAQTLIAQKYSKGPFRAFGLAKKHHFSGVSISKWWVNPYTYLRCRVSKKIIMTYTVDSKFGIKVLQKMYPRLLICTNYPDVYRSVYSQDT
jgi:glycerophosphoryl diester phosphodiesterase